MYLIQPLLTKNNLNNDSLNCLIKSINNKIGDIATRQYLNEVYALNKFVDLDLYEDLCDFQEILLDKLLGCNCLDEESILYITSKIQRLIDIN